MHLLLCMHGTKHFGTKFNCGHHDCDRIIPFVMPSGVDGVVNEWLEEMTYLESNQY
jgi:hypothetical protein